MTEWLETQQTRRAMLRTTAGFFATLGLLPVPSIGYAQTPGKSPLSELPGSKVNADLTRYIPFVAPEREQEYLETHHLGLTRLPNGIQILAAPSLTEDSIAASIDLSLASGAYNDPKGKEGLHHFLEHAAANTLYSARASDLGTSVNAYTSIRAFGFTIQGISNPDIRQYGVWQFLDSFAKQYTNPFGHLADVSAEIERQRAIVKREIAERKSGKNEKISQFIRETFYASDNPLVTDTLGTPAIIDQISREELLRLASDIFITDGTNLIIKTSGPYEVSDILRAEFEGLLGPVPKHPKRANRVPYEWTSRLNPNYFNGGHYINTETITNGVMKVGLNWTFEGLPYSPEDYALEVFEGIVQDPVMDASRDAGLSYGSQTSAGTDPKHHHFSIGTKLDLGESLETQAAELLELTRTAIAQVPPDRFLVDERSRLRDLATPVSRSAINSGFIGGITNYGKIIDAAEIKARRLQVTEAQLKEWRERILDTPPAVVIHGVA